MNKILYIFFIVLASLYSCDDQDDQCILDEDALRGQWLQRNDVLMGGGDAEIIYEFSPPGLFRVLNRGGTAYPAAGFKFNIDEDLCEISWYHLNESPTEPRYSWSNIYYSDRKMIVDMVDPRLDSILAKAVVLRRVK